MARATHNKAASREFHIIPPPEIHNQESAQN